MRFLMRHRPSPAMVVACLALTVALGGTSYAAIKLPENSVGARQLKKNAVASPKIKNNAITGADVLESSLARVPSAASATSAGTAAPRGPAAGGLVGTYPAPSIAPNAVASSSVVDASQATGLRKADLAAVSTTASFDPPNIPADTCQGVSTTVPGAQMGDAIVVRPSSDAWPRLMWAPWTVAGANNLVYLWLCNPTSAAYDGGARNFDVLLIR